jgi:hypothetical protein
MTPARGRRRRREVGLDVEERGAGNVPFEIELAAAPRVSQLPAAVDELVLQRAIR